MTLARIPNPEITKMPETEPDAVPELWNGPYREMDANFINLDGRQSATEDEVAGARQGKASLGETMAEIVRQIGGLSDDVNGLASPASVQKAVNLDWLYRGQRVSIELFAEGYSLQSLKDTAVVSGVLGDDSIDIADTSLIKVGHDYLLSDADGIAIVRVKDVLSLTRIRITTNLSRNWGSAAVITGLTMKPRTAGGGVTALEGDSWVSSAINLGTDNKPRAIVIRRTLNAGTARLYYRDANGDWAEAFWSTRRAGGGTTGVPDGYADYEYLAPIRGDGFIRVDVDGEAMDILHIVALAGSTGLGGYVNPQMRPDAPVNSNPAAAAIDVGERPTLSVTSFSSPAGNKVAATQFQISATEAFTAVLHDSGDVSGVSYAMPASVLLAGTTYYLRARFKDAAGLVSDWGVVSSFATKATFAYVNAPVVTSPTAGQTEIPEELTLQTAAFAVVGEDTHSATQWQVRLASGTWASPLYDSGEVADLTAHNIPPSVLSAGQTQYVVRARHKGALLGLSEWSQDITFVTKDLFAQIIGIVQVSAGGGAGSWQRINEKFEAITTNPATFANHPIYAGIIDQIVDGQAMVRIPKHYEKRGSVPSGVYVGKPFRLLSDQPVEGFTVVTAFKEAGAVVDQFWAGKYQGTADGAKLGSKAGAMPLVSIDFPTMQARAAARNTAGVSGFMMWTIYQLAAIQTLALIEMGGSDSQALIGQGNVSGSTVLAVDHATVAQATWRGIVGLWGNIWQMVDGLQTNANRQYKIWDGKGNKTYQETAKVAPANGWSVTMELGKGADFDMGAIFAAATTNTTEGNGTYADYFYASTNCVAYTGGTFGNGSTAGLFHLDVSNAASHAHTRLGSRLAKV